MGEEERLMPVLITEKPASATKPPPAPPLPAQWPQACFPPRTSRDETRASQLSRQLERYQSVALDKKDEEHKVTITVGGQEEDKKSAHEASLWNFILILGSFTNFDEQFNERSKYYPSSHS